MHKSSSEITEHLFSLLYQNMSLQLIVNYGFECFGDNIMSVADTSGKIMAISAQAVFQDPVLLEQSESSYVNDAVFRAFKRDRHFQTMAQNHSAFFADYKTEENPELADVPYGWIFSSVRIHSVTAAYLMICGLNSPFTEKDLHLAGIFAKAISIELQKNEFFLHTHGISYESLLNDILDRRILNPAMIGSRMALLGKKAFPKYYVLTITSWNKNPSAALQKAVQQTTLRNYFRNSISVIYHEQVVLLLDTAHDLPPASEELEDFIEYLDHSRLIAGMSNPFSDLSQTPDAYQESILALKLGPEFHQAALYPYLDYAIYSMMKKCLNDYDLSSMCIPGLYEIWRSGSEFDRELLHTLFLYVRNMKSAAKVSDMLGIHKNSLFYRISKITASFHIDLNNGEDIFKVLLTDKILQFLDKIRQGGIDTEATD